MNLHNLKESFHNQDLFDQAFTHRSWVNENKSIRRSNERLEFLGDAVLEFVASDVIFRRFMDKEEGYLTALRANLVNTENLAIVAQNLNVGELLYLSKGEDEGGGRLNKSLLADTVEAIIGAIYIDKGYEEAREFINNHVLANLEEKLKSPLKDPKSRLQEKIQAMGYPAPKYHIVSEEGPDHAKKFIVEVKSVDKVLSQGQGRSKSVAEQEAAKAALEILGDSR